MNFERSLPEEKICYFNNKKRQIKKSVRKLIPDYWDYKINSQEYTQQKVQGHNAFGFTKKLWWEVVFSCSNYKESWPTITIKFSPCSSSFQSSKDFRLEIHGHSTENFLNKLNCIFERDIPKICACASQIIHKMDHRNF